MKQQLKQQKFIFNSSDNFRSLLMKKQNRFFLALFFVIFLFMSASVNAQAPPPPSHSQNGNQVSPGGTGCPIDRTDGIIIALVISLAYGGFALYQKNKKKIAE